MSAKSFPQSLSLTGYVSGQWQTLAPEDYTYDVNTGLVVTLITVTALKNNGNFVGGLNNVFQIMPDNWSGNSMALSQLVPSVYVEDTFMAFSEAYDVVWRELLLCIENMPQDLVFPDTSKKIETWLADKGNPLQNLLTRIPESKLRPLATKLFWWYNNRGLKLSIKTMLELLLDNLTVTCVLGIEECWKLEDAVRGVLGKTTVLLGSEGSDTLTVYVSRILTPEERDIVDIVVRFCIPANFYYRIVTQVQV